MLVLSRRRNQSIVVDGPAVVSIVRIGKDAVRLGIVADCRVAVHRKEIYDKIQRANGDQTHD